MLTLAFSGIVERLTLRVDVLDAACVRWILREEHLDSLDGSGALAQEALITTCPDQLILPSGDTQPLSLSFEPRTSDLESGCDPVGGGRGPGARPILLQRGGGVG